MNRYEVIIYWSQEDGVFVAEVPQLPGCMAHGKTQAVALRNVNGATERQESHGRKERAEEQLSR